MRIHLIFFLWAAILASPVWAIQSLYLGGRVGISGFSPANYDAAGDTLGYGGDLGLRFNDYIELQAQIQASNHATSASPLHQFSQLLSFEFHPFKLQSLNMSLGAGVGQVTFNDSTGSESDFLMSFGAIADVILDNGLILGMNSRWYGPFNGHIGTNFWSIMMRVGFSIQLDRHGPDRIYIR